jgi:hypothetical protein
MRRADGPSFAFLCLTMIQLQLAHEDATFLCQQLELWIAHLEHEVAHTENREMQRAISKDIEQLERIVGRIIGIGPASTRKAEVTAANTAGATTAVSPR